MFAHTVVCPAMVDRLLSEAGFRVVKRSRVPEGFKELGDATGPAHGNLYEGRDYLCVCEAVVEEETAAHAFMPAPALASDAPAPAEEVGGGGAEGEEAASASAPTASARNGDATGGVTEGVGAGARGCHWPRPITMCTMPWRPR